MTGVHVVFPSLTFPTSQRVLNLDQFREHGKFALAVCRAYVFEQACY